MLLGLLAGTACGISAAALRPAAAMPMETRAGPLAADASVAEGPTVYTGNPLNFLSSPLKENRRFRLDRQVGSDVEPMSGANTTINTDQPVVELSLTLNDDKPTAKPGKPGERRQARSDSDEPTLGQVVRMLINVEPEGSGGGGGSAPQPVQVSQAPAEGEGPDDPPRDGSNQGFLTELLNTTINQEFIDVIRESIEPSVTSDGTVTFSLGGLGRFVVVRGSANGELLVMETQSGYGMQVYRSGSNDIPQVAPRPRQSPTASAEAPEPPRVRTTTISSGPSVITQIRQIIHAPLTWMVLALLAISWMLYAVAAKRE